MSDQKVNELAGRLFREEAGKMASVLARLFSFQNLETAEDIVQETLLKAVTVWRYKGIPENPTGWLYTVAKRKAIDIIRHHHIRMIAHEKMIPVVQSEWTLSSSVNQYFQESEIEDSQLRMIFACCHPAIPFDSQVALTLKTLCGLSISEIARSFLTTEETITKRLYRAREKIRTEKISMEVPLGSALASRSDAVLQTIYLLFNEGYNSSHPDQLIRNDFCEDAIHLAFLLTRNPVTNLPKVNALLSLMCLQASRENARLDQDGAIILLKDQNRDLWNRSLIERGLQFLNVASETEEVTEYHVEAAIAACHSISDDFTSTDWSKIINLYHVLSEIKPGPVVEMNKAIAIGFWKSPAAGLEELLRIRGLENHYLYFTAIGDFYSDCGERVKALHAFDRALSLVTSNAERKLIDKKRMHVLK